MITIQVTQDDIDNGVRLSGKLCPIALACLRTIGMNYAEVFDLWGWCNDIPTEVQDFVLAFDRDLPVQPFSFTLPDSITTSEAP
jgi:hypothetical protein